MASPVNLKQTEELDESIKKFLGALTNELVKKKVEEAATAIGKSKATIHAMKREGSGSAVSFVKLLMHSLDLEKDDLTYLVHNISELADAKKGQYRLSQKLFKDVQRYTDENELIGWLRLLLAKVQIEADMGTRPPPKPPIEVLNE